jgi:nicotinamidase-related amidase
MSTGRQHIESIDELHARFVRRREQSAAQLPSKLTWVGSLLVLPLRKHGIDKVILGGMSANLCTESHMRELLDHQRGHAGHP